MYTYYAYEDDADGKGTAEMDGMRVLDIDFDYSSCVLCIIMGSVNGFSVIYIYIYKCISLFC